jgi:BMFP domain-containing protein YqiC
MENMEANPEWMKSMIEQHPEMLEGMVDQRMMEKMMSADTIETMITAMPPETMNKMMAQMMKDNPAMLQDMMTDMIKNNPQMLQSIFSNMDEATMNQMFSTIMKDYDMVMTGGEMVIKLPPDTAKLIGHEYVVVEITSDMGMKDMQFSMQKKQNT